MVEPRPRPFTTNLADEDIATIVPSGLDIEDLSGWELLRWAEGNVPQAFRESKKKGLEISGAILVLCDLQTIAAHELGLDEEVAFYTNTKHILENGVIMQGLGQTSLQQLVSV